MKKILIEDVSQIGHARREAGALAKTLGFDQAEAGRASIVASQLASNILRYGGGGEILLDRVERKDARVQIIALDKGSGIPDTETALIDGYTTSKSSGTGLGSVRRHSALFDIYSRINQGTAVLSEVSAGPAPHRQVFEHPSVGGVAVPMPGEDVCGDAWCVRHLDDGPLLILADGLGHGHAAADAAHTALSAFLDHAGRTVEEITEAVHLASRSGRGSAIGLLRVDRAQGNAEFCGLGNVEANLFGTAGRSRMVSEPGVAGASAKRIRAFSYSTQDRSIAILNTDGLASQWSFDQYPGLLPHNPTLIAAILYRDFTRGRDDTGVLVARW